MIGVAAIDPTAMSATTAALPAATIADDAKAATV
jgi:hypothetical protein